MFTGLNASIADEEGNLLFYSNGCQVVDANHQIMPNGTELNNNDYFESLGFSCASGYIGQQDILILPDPVNELGYYIFHKPIIKKKEEVNEKYRELRYSYVDLSLNNGRGEVTEKNIIISGEHELAYSYLTAIPHSNGKDWWIINPTKDSNEYLTILLNKNGVSQVSTQAIGPDFHWNASAGGLAQFSPDGNTYAYF